MFKFINQKIVLLLSILFALIFINSFLFGYWGGLITAFVDIALIIYVWVYHIAGIGRRK